jgi:hypothetical protein
LKNQFAPTQLSEIKLTKKASSVAHPNSKTAEAGVASTISSGKTSCSMTSSAVLTAFSCFLSSLQQNTQHNKRCRDYQTKENEQRYGTGVFALAIFSKNKRAKQSPEDRKQTPTFSAGSDLYSFSFQRAPCLSRSKGLKSSHMRTKRNKTAASPSTNARMGDCLLFFPAHVSKHRSCSRRHRTAVSFGDHFVDSPTRVCSPLNSPVGCRWDDGDSA